MKTEILNLGPYFTNCYCAEGEDYAFIVDPAGDSPQFDAFINRNKNKPNRAVLLTHCHADHIGYAENAAKKFDSAVYIGEFDVVGANNPEINLSLQIYGYAFCLTGCIPVKNGQIIKLGSAEIKVMHTPGHTSGGVCYIVENSVFSGDTIMCGTYGRYDLPTGNGAQLFKSLKAILRLNGNYEILPGHTPKTTVNAEKKNYNF